LAPRNRRTRAAARALRLITARQIIGTLRAAHRRQRGHDGGEDNRRPRRRTGGWDGPVQDRWHRLRDRSGRPRADPRQHRPAVSRPHGGRCRRPDASL